MMKTYYIENAGTDLPRKTENGDILLFKRGRTYSGVHLMITADNVTVGAYGDGNLPVLTDPADNRPAILLEGIGYKISNIEIDGYLLGIAATNGHVENIEISDCYIHNITSGRYFPELPPLPIGAPLSFGLWLHGVRNVKVINTVFDNTDSPMQLCGSHILLDRLNITDSHIQGIMIYGARNISRLEEVLAVEGDICVQNCRIFHTGDRAAFFGSTGILIENVVNCVVKDSEIAYTVNTVGAYDSCAADWEQNNINCVFDNIYAHDNQGPFLLAMEHPESLGNSRGNIIRNCLSVNNGIHGTGESGTFINHSSYVNKNQIIRIENCRDYGAPGSVPYRYEFEGKIQYREDIRNTDLLDVNGFVSGNAEVYEYFEDQKLSDGIKIDGKYIWQCGGITMPDGGKITVENNGRQSLFYATVMGEVTVNGTDKYGDPGEWTHIELNTSEKDGFIELSVGKNAVITELALYHSDGNKRIFNNYNDISHGDRFEFNTANGKFAFMSPETEWQADGVDEWVYRPFFAGTAILNGNDATVSREVNVRIKTANVGVVLMNGSDNGLFEFGFEKNGKWIYVPFATAFMNPDIPVYENFRSRHPAMRLYTLNLEDVPEYSGDIQKIRLRLKQARGMFAVRSVILNL